MKIIIEDSKNNLSHEYYDVPVKIMKSIKTLLDSYDNIVNSELHLCNTADKIIIHPWKLGGEEFPYDIPYGNIYLDGKLEDMNGYDLCGVENFPYITSPNDGFRCDVLLNGDTIKARLFLWKSKFNIWKGLVVAEDDEEALRKAKRKREMYRDII